MDTQASSPGPVVDAEAGNEDATKRLLGGSAPPPEVNAAADQKR
jgi:hypothetical protein